MNKLILCEGKTDAILLRARFKTRELSAKCQSGKLRV